MEYEKGECLRCEEILRLNYDVERWSVCRRFEILKGLGYLMLSVSLLWFEVVPFLSVLPGCLW